MELFQPQKSEKAPLLTVSLLYAAMYLLLFQFVDSMAGFAGFSLWFPAAGLRFALIVVFGWRFGLLAAVIEILMQGLVGEWANWAYQPGFIVMGIAAPPLIYSLVLGTLHHFRLAQVRSASHLQFVWLAFAAIVIPFLTAPVSTAMQIWGGRLPDAAFAEAVISFGVGDMVGVLMTAPIAIVGFNLWASKNYREASYYGVLTKPVFWIELGLASALSAAGLFLLPDVFMTLRALPLFIPILWMALRYGFVGAAGIIPILNVLVVMIAVDMTRDARFDLQMLLGLLSFVGAVLGGMNTFRREAEVKASEQVLAVAHEDRTRFTESMAAQIIHELAQPTSITSMYAKESAKMLAKGDYKPEQIKEALDRIAHHTARINKMISSIKQFAARGVLTKAETDIGTVFYDVRELIDIFAGNMGVEVSYDIAEPLPVMVDAIQIQQAILNLAKNAIEAMAETEGKQLSISAKRQNGHVHIAIKDTGPGLPKDLAAGVSTKPDGMGMGLRITEEIVRAHGGRLVWASPNEVIIILER